MTSITVNVLALDMTQTKKPGDGDLAIFCSICPQPGINIPDDWKEDPQRYLMP